jgi:acetyltransferase-like isoleucine patch superfamily enzyme
MMSNFFSQPVGIEDDVWLGTEVIIKPNATIDKTR